MPGTTFLGEIVGGLIRTEQELGAFEGKKVSVTVLDPPTPASPDSGSGVEASPLEPLSGGEEPVLLEDLGRIRAARREVTPVYLTVRDVGRRPVPVYSSDEED